MTAPDPSRSAADALALIREEEGTFVTDQVSGTTYCTRSAWDALRSTLQETAKGGMPA